MMFLNPDYYKGIVSKGWDSNLKLKTKTECLPVTLSTRGLYIVQPPRYFIQVYFFHQMISKDLEAICNLPLTLLLYLSTYLFCHH